MLDLMGRVRAWFDGTDAGAFYRSDPDLYRPGFADWRDGYYPERRRALNEAHARTGYPIKPYARITILSRRFSSQEDIFRNELMRQEDPDRHERLEKDLRSESDETRRRAEIEWLAWTEEQIRDLKPNFYGPANTARAIQLSDVMVHSLKEWKNTRHSARAEAELAKLEALYTDPASPLYVDEAAREAFLGEGEHDERLMRPYYTAGSLKYRWFNFWRLDGEVANRRQLRVNSERFGLNQTFTAIEDFDGDPDGLNDAPVFDPGPAPDARSRALFDSHPGVATEDEAVDLPINKQWTAVDTLNQQLDALSEHMHEPFRWYGSLASAAHVWVIPISRAMKGMPRSDRKTLVAAMKAEIRAADASAGAKASDDRVQDTHQRFIDSIAAFAADFFNYPDLTRFGGPRRDFVMSKVVGGRAILISDLRPYSRDQDARSEKAVRAIILDIDLSEEQRGRLLRRLGDIFAANTLATRGFLHVDAINGVLNEIGVGLSYCYSRMLDIANRPPASLERMGVWDPEAEKTGAKADAEYEAQIRREFTVNLLRLRQLSTHLSGLNHFITYGVSGAALASQDFRKLMDDRVAALRESRIGGFQTLEEFMRRFGQVNSTIDRMAERYDVLRRRLGEASQLFRAEAEGLELASIERQSEHQTRLLTRNDFLSFLVIGFGLIAVIEAVRDGFFDTHWYAVPLIFVGAYAIARLTPDWLRRAERVLQKRKNR